MMLANQVVDFVDDVDKAILKSIAENAPQHIKVAQVLSVDAREKLDPDQFALVCVTNENQVLKKFPISDADSTWLSCQYFEKTSEQLPWVAQKIAATNLRRACAVYNVSAPSQVEKYASHEVNGNRYDERRDWKEDAKRPHQTKIAAAHKPDGSAHFYALGGKYGMPDGAYVKKAAAYFLEHEKDFGDVEDRHVFADNVLARAKELNVDLECADNLRKYASEDYGDSVVAQIRLRQEILQHQPEMVAALDKLASHKVGTDAPTFAKALYLFDKKAGITRHYGSAISDAFKATFGSFHKSAGYRWEDEASGSEISEKDLVRGAENKYDRVKAYFGVTLADGLKKHAVAIFDSLPQDAKGTLVRIFKGEV